MKPKRRQNQRSSAKKLTKGTAKTLPAPPPRPVSVESELFGVYSATVTDTRDPLGLGRVEVVVAAVSKTPEWASLATLMAGNQCGTWFVPNVGDEVLVAFEA